MGGTFFIFKILYQINETYLNGYIIDSLDFLALSSVLSSIFVIISQNPISSVLFLITLFISIAGYLILLGLNFIGISYLLVYVGAVSILFLFILMLINVRISELLSNTNKSIPLAIFIIISFIYTFYPMIPDNYISLLDKLGSFAASEPSLFLKEGWLAAEGSSSAFEGGGCAAAEHDSSFLQSGEIGGEVRGPLLPAFNKARQAEDIFNNFFSIIHLISLISSQRDNVFYVTGKSWDGCLSESSHITSIGNIMYTSYSIWLIITSIILLLAMVGCIVITLKKD